MEKKPTTLHFKKFILFIIIVFYLIYKNAAAETPFLKPTPKYHSIAEMYEEKDLGASSLFAGGFINFGYWNSPLQNPQISSEERIESERNLYRHILKKLSITTKDKVLEVGCGQGEGTSLIFTEFQPREIHGIDFSPVQITRAKNRHQFLLKNSGNNLRFRIGNAIKIPYPQARFNKVISIEAAQHFSNLDKFCNEAFRVLKPNGQLVVATFFATSKNSSNLLPTIIQTIADGIDYAIPIYEFKKTLQNAGFEKIEIESIGKNVWQGFDQWISQGELKDSWNRNWYKAYKRGLVDYYIVSAQKSNRDSLPLKE